MFFLLKSGFEINIQLGIELKRVLYQTHIIQI